MLLLILASCCHNSDLYNHFQIQDNSIDSHAHRHTVLLTGCFGLQIVYDRSWWMNIFISQGQ